MHILTQFYHGFFACVTSHRYQPKGGDVTAISVCPRWLEVSELLPACPTQAASFRIHLEVLAESLNKYQPTTADHCVASPLHCFSSARDQAVLVNHTTNAMADQRIRSGVRKRNSLK
jgi:hypothetical protein